jgi:hypothetical protein
MSMTFSSHQNVGNSVSGHIELVAFTKHMHQVRDMYDNSIMKQNETVIQTYHTM